MKEFALVSSSSGFTVMYYRDWMECPIGCVLFTSDDLDSLRDEVDRRNCDIWGEGYWSSDEVFEVYKSL
jgi:hypothetical protein